MMAGTRERPIVSAHARRRIKQMGLTDHKVAHALSEPEIEYRGSEKHGPGRRVAVADGIAVVYRETTQGVRVITVLWHRAEGRTDDD